MKTCQKPDHQAVMQNDPTQVVTKWNGKPCIQVEYPCKSQYQTWNQLIKRKQVCCKEREFNKIKYI